jgi:tRNA threonylcarbamoyladenosine biosynthesis protein TsaE
MSNNKHITEDFSETQKLGESFIKKTNKKIIALYGDLGSGKTTFVQGIAKGLGIKRRIISPTFVVIRSYKINNKKIRAKYFYHVDLYRIERTEDVLNMELEEIIRNSENIVVVEWPEKIEKILPEGNASIRFKYISENKRRILINE